MSYLKIISQNFVISPRSKQMRRRQLMSADAAAASIIAQPAPIQGKDEKKISRRSAPFFIILKCIFCLNKNCSMVAIFRTPNKRR